MIDKDTISHIAKLARLSLTQSEIDSLAIDLSNSLGYVEKLNSLNTDNVEPTTHVLRLSNVWREDKVEAVDSKPLLDNAPSKEGAYFRVPKVLE